MAERYGGKYSPGGPGSAPQGPVPQLRRARAGMRVNLLFFLPLPLVVRAFGQDAAGLALTLAGFGLLLLAAWLTREGELAQEAWEARKVARRPAFPRKIFGSLLTGAGLLVATVPDNSGLFAPALVGVLGAALHFLAFGPDPLSDKGMEGIDTHAQDRAARAVDEAEAYLSAMRDAVLRLRDRTLEGRVERFAAAARTLFRQVESDPRDLVAAKKYMTVYLMGARDATVKFVDLYSARRDPAVRADYEALLADLEGSFAQRTEALMGNDRTDLDIEIGVLRERLAREGVSL